MSTRAYYKPLRGGGSRIIHRASSGRFTRVYIEVDICPHCCGGNTLETVNVGSQAFPLLKRRHRETCCQCGKPMNKKETPT